MSEAIRLYIVTDDVAQAVRAEIGCGPSEVPSFIRVLTEAVDIAAIPDGARCIGRWFRWSDKRPTPAQYAWIDRRNRGGIEGVSQAFYARIDEWNEKRRAAEVEVLAAAIAERLPAGEAQIPPPASMPIPKPQSRYT